MSDILYTFMKTIASHSRTSGASRAGAWLPAWRRFSHHVPWASVLSLETKTAAVNAPGIHFRPSARGEMTDEVAMTGKSSVARNDPPMLEIQGLTHFYGTTRALDDVSLSARRGEFLTILGESGSGKTTMLRIISGLERPTQVARLAIDGEEVSGKPAAMRNCTTVFQHYALFPHMSAGENAAMASRSVACRNRRPGSGFRRCCASCAWPTRGIGASTS